MLKEILNRGFNQVNIKSIFKNQFILTKNTNSQIFIKLSKPNICEFKNKKNIQILKEKSSQFSNHNKYKSFSTHSTNKHIQKGKERYLEILKKSINDETREEFWDTEAKEIDWFKTYDLVIEDSNKPFYRWFRNGETNIVYNCIDRHLNTELRSSLAFIWESAYLNKIRTFTYEELDVEVKKICKILMGNNIKKGDRVIIYMPMLPEAVFSMLACAKLGIVHSVVFGGFASEELANRIKDCEPKMIITASAGIEPKRIIPYYPIVKDALKQLNNISGN